MVQLADLRDDRERERGRIQRGEPAPAGEVDPNDDEVDPAQFIVLTAESGFIQTAGGTGGISSTGPITLKADEGITLDDSISSAGGTINLVADSNPSGGDNGVFTVNDQLSSGGGAGMPWVPAFSTAAFQTYTPK